MSRGGGHLVVVTETWPSTRNPISGIYVAEQVEAFTRHYARVTVIVVLPRFKRDRALSLPELGLDGYPGTATVHEVHSLRVPTPANRLGGMGIRWNLASTRRRICASLFSLVDRSELDVIVHAGRYAPATLGRIVAEYRPKRSCIIFHGEDGFFEQSPNGSWLARKARDSVRSGSHTVAVGKSLLPYLERVFEFNDVAVIPNGTRQPASVDVAGEAEHEAVLSAVRILSVSNLAPNKGIDVQLRALGYIAQVRPDLEWEYRVVGDGTELDSLKELSGSLGISERVTFLGRLSRDRTLLEFSSCDVFSLPSWREAFGIVYLEAMARGKPVIACRGVGPVGLVVHMENGLLVEAKSEESLTGSLASLIQDLELRRKLGAKAKADSASFSWEANVMKILKLSPSL